MEMIHHGKMLDNSIWKEILSAHFDVLEELAAEYKKKDSKVRTWIKPYRDSKKWVLTVMEPDFNGSLLLEDYCGK